MADPNMKDLAYRAFAAALGTPVDLATMAMRPFGYKVQNPVMGSEWIGQKMENQGIISEARDPMKEFVASVMFPTPTGMATGAAKGAAMLPMVAGMAKIPAFHGTTKVFDEFSTSLRPARPNWQFDEDTVILNRLGSHFGTPKAAEEILQANLQTSGRDVDWKLAKEVREQFPEASLFPAGGNIRPVELDLKNPYFLGPESDLSDLLLKAGVSIESRAAPATKANKIKQYLESQGYDGVKYVNQFEDPGSFSYIVFDPSKIAPKFGK